MTRNMQTFRMNRRALLGGMAGVSVLFAGRTAFASESGRRKLVVIIARGGLAGLSVSPPYGDRELPCAPARHHRHPAAGRRTAAR